MPALSLAPLYSCDTLRDPQGTLSVSLYQIQSRANSASCMVHHLNTDCAFTDKPVGFACLRVNDRAIYMIWQTGAVGRNTNARNR